jgi:predicted nucleic acid-binding protein
LQSEGKVIGAYDLIVAATALERGSHLATFNKRHFAMVKGLYVVEQDKASSRPLWLCNIGFPSLRSRP